MVSTMKCLSVLLQPRILAFFALVFLGVTTQVAFKLSQRDGKYEYNTMSAMTVVEGIKLCMSLVQHLNNHGNSIHQACQDFGNVHGGTYLTYFLLAASYAVYNQLIFAVMCIAEPGTFSLLKSFSPAMVSVMNCSMFGEALTQNQCTKPSVFKYPLLGDQTTHSFSFQLLLCVRALHLYSDLWYCNGNCQ